SVFLMLRADALTGAKGSFLLIDVNAERTGNLHRRISLAETIEVRCETDQITTGCTDREVGPAAGSEVDKLPRRLSVRVGLVATHSAPSRRPSGSQRDTSTSDAAREASAIR